MVLEHLPDLVEEDACLRLAIGSLGLILPLLSSAEEDLTLRKGEAQQSGEARNSGASPELFTPAGPRDEVQINDSGDEVSTGVSLLHNSAGKATSLDREVLKGRGRGQSPDTSHTDTEKTSDGEELVEGLDEAAAKGERRNKEEVGDQWPLPTKPIRNKTKGNSADGPEQQGECDRRSNIMGAAVELLFQVRDGKGDTEEVDRVARPS